MNHPGSTDFDVKDRLAIINLCNSYADCYDKGDMDQWFELFTEDIKCSIYLSDNTPTIASGDEFRSLLNRFRTGAEAAGTAPLHCNTNLNIQQQTNDRAVAETYILYIPMEVAAFNVPEKSLTETRITGTARYLFNLLKGDDGIWRIDDYSITYKQSVVEQSAAAA